MHNLFRRYCELIYCAVAPVLTIVVTFSLMYLILHVMESGKNILTERKDILTEQEDNLNWCCKIGNKYNIIPAESWGTVDESNPLRTEWSHRFCDNIIGGGGRSNCQNTVVE